MSINLESIVNTVLTLTQQERIHWVGNGPYQTIIDVDNAKFTLILDKEAKFRVNFKHELLGTLQNEATGELYNLVTGLTNILPATRLAQHLQNLVGEEPEIDYPIWVQPQGAHNAYPLGAKVRHNGINWESTVANNVWPPSVYGWRQL